MLSAPPPAALEAVRPSEPSAIIAEARKHARRRRWRTALAVVVAAGMGGGLMLTDAFAHGRTAGGLPGQPLPLAARTGEVTGYIDPCSGLARLPFAAGTVTALRGRETWNPAGGGYQPQLPATAVAAREHVAKNQAFALHLTAGQYTLVARNDGTNFINFITVTVRAGHVVRQNVPDGICD